MKIALCFHGLPRLIDKCYPDIYNYFIKNNDIDIYAHFWWDDSYKGKINRFDIKERYPTDINPIEVFEKLYNPKKIVYEKCPENFDCSEYSTEGWNTSHIKDDNLINKLFASIMIYGALYCRFYSVNKVLNLVNNLEDYDIVIIVRSDTLTFNQSSNFIYEINNLDFNKYIYFPSTKHGGPKYAGEHPNRLGDWLFFGNYKNILTYSKFYCDY